MDPSGWEEVSCRGDALNEFELTQGLLLRWGLASLTNEGSSKPCQRKSEGRESDDTSQKVQSSLIFKPHEKHRTRA